MALEDRLARALRSAAAEIQRLHDVHGKHYEGKVGEPDLHTVDVAHSALAQYDAIPMPCTLPYIVDTVYRIALHSHITTSTEQLSAWFERTFKLSCAKRYKDVHVVTTDLGPCWAGYITLESTNRNAAMALADRLVTAARILKIKLDR